MIAQHPIGDTARGEEVASKYPHLTTAVEERAVGVSPVVYSLTEKLPIAAVAVPFENAGEKLVISGGVYLEDTPISQYLSGVTTISGTEAQIIDDNKGTVAQTPEADRLFKSEEIFTSSYRIPGAPWALQAGISFEKLFTTAGQSDPVWVVSIFNALFGGIVLTLLFRLRKKKDDLKKQAFHDPLTGLATRRLADDRLSHALARMVRNETGVGLAMIDLDNFKTVNDSLGHRGGDLLLTAIAERIGGAIRNYDTAARIGGDEFLVVMDDCDSATSASEIAQRILDSLETPFQIEEQTIHAGATIGIAFSNEEIDGQELLRRADLALYAAKEAGKAQVELFSPPLDEKDADNRRLRLDIDSAVAKEELYLEFQPIYDLNTGEVRSVETLSRWNHEGTEVGPGVFIPIAEETGHIVEIGRWVISEALAAFSMWKKAAGVPESTGLHINISGRQLLDPHLIRLLTNECTRLDIPAQRVTLEITETWLVDDHARATLIDLASIGFPLAVDDFGSAYASLTYLKDLPISMIKIDRGLISTVLEGPEGAAVAYAALSLGKQLNLDVVAEGIESQQQLQALLTRGCTLGQGFHLGRPTDLWAVAVQLEGGLFTRSGAPRVSDPVGYHHAVDLSPSRI